MVPRSLRADPRALLAGQTQVIRLPWGVARFSPGNTGLAVVVPKKAAKLSVVRHLAKRRVAGALLGSLPNGFQVMVTLNAAGVSARGEKLRAWCHELGERILQSTHA